MLHVALKVDRHITKDKICNDIQKSFPCFKLQKSKVVFYYTKTFRWLVETT